MLFSFVTALALCFDPVPNSDPGPLVQSLWLVQQYGATAALDPAVTRESRESYRGL
jgi:hypothetical protein